MTDALTVRANLGTGLSFDVETGSGHHIILDAAEHSGGQDAGPRPLEMLLVGLAGCAGISVLSILRKRREEITAYEIRIRGERADDYPKEFVTITVEHRFTGRNILPESVQLAIELTEARYCPVSTMLAEAAEVNHVFHIVQEE